MADGDLAKDFAEKAPPPPVMEPAEYLLLLEKLITEGKPVGKTVPVAAYFLTDIKFDQLDDAGNKIGETKIEVKPAYVVMDMSLLKNEYARRLTVEDIAVQYAKRNIGIKDINSPDFKGSYVWTAKKKAFEEDYKRRDGELNEYGKPSNIWDPQPEAYRLTLQFNKAATIPVEWGTYPMYNGSNLAVRSKDIPAVVAALKSIRSGEKSIEDALYTKNEEGETITRFDIYGMDPGFLEANYKPVELQPAILQVIADFSAQPQNMAKAAAIPSQRR